MARRPDIGYFEGDKDLLDISMWQEAILPLEKAANIDPLVYRSLTFSLLENEALWTRDWIFIGTSDDVANSGDLLPYTIGNHGIHVQRMDDGTLSGRFNNAQHGGCRVVPLQCQQGSKTKCSFTSCGYSSDRDVIKADSKPAEDENSAALMYQFLGLRPERLLPVLVVEADGLIFVNLDGTDKDFSGSAVQSELEKLEISSTRVPRADKTSIEINVNWKLFAHALFSNFGGNVLCSENSISSQLEFKTDGGNSVLVDATLLYPNLITLRLGDAYCWLSTQPTALQKTKLRMHFYHNSEGSLTSELRSLAQLITHIAQLAEAMQTSVIDKENNSQVMCENCELSVPDYWLQSTLINRVLSMPRNEASDLMYQPLKNYLI